MADPRRWLDAGGDVEPAGPLAEWLWNNSVADWYGEANYYAEVLQQLHAEHPDWFG